MEIVLYITILFIGLVVGSFSTLAIHRLPLHQDIIYKRSYCPKCEHKLSFCDLIPVVSYIFLRGKCRYCKEKVSPRYLILELITGIVFLLFTISIFSGYQIRSLEQILYLVWGLLYITGLILIAGIDKEKRIINTGVLLYELVIISSYMIYLYMTEQNINVYRYVTYLAVMLLLIINDTFYLKKTLKSNYIIKLLLLSIMMSCFAGEAVFLVTVAFTLISISMSNIICKILKKRLNKKIPVGYFLCWLNIIVLIATNFLVLGGYNG